jgi:hypothetical protein
MREQVKASVPQHKMERGKMEKIIKSGVVPAFQLDNGDILHFFGDTIDLTDSKLNLKAIYKRTGRFSNE